MPLSPIFRLDRQMAEAPARAAPEKEAALHEIANSVALCFEDQRGDFMFSASTGQVTATAGGLNILWCASYAYLLIYSGFQEAQLSGNSEYRPGDDATSAPALHLYRWALEAATVGELRDWPDGYPQPDPALMDGSPLHHASEIFLVALAWIILPELGHIQLKHPLQTVSPTSLAEEHDADRFASEWLLDSATPEVILKRTLGVAVANIVLIVIDLVHGSPAATTHPKPVERLQRNLRCGQLADESPVHAFTAALLQFHLTVFGVDHRVNLDGAFAELVDDMCFDLHRHS